MTRRPARARATEPSSWTRPQQVVAAAYGVWVTVLTIAYALYQSPARTAPLLRAHGVDEAGIRAATAGWAPGLVATALLSVLYLAIAFCSWRGQRWAFWGAVVAFGFTGLGAIWVPLRPMAHLAETPLVTVVHAGVIDGPGLLVAVWLVVGLVRYGRGWARRRVVSSTA